MRESTTYVFLLGCRASGKTSFLSGLAVLSRGGSDSPFQLVTEDGQTTRMITDLRSLAEQQQWPPPTSSMAPLTFELSYASPYGERRFQIALLDYPGEDLLEAMETLNFEERRPLEEQFERADYVLVVADPTQDLITRLTTDSVEARRRQDALFQAVGQLVKHRRQSSASRRSRPEIAIIISKRDMLEGDRAIPVETILEENKAFLKKLTRFSSSRPRCFLVTSCGETARDAGGHMLPPATPRPAGYEPLFDWLSQRHFWAKNRRRFGLACGVLLLLLLLATGYVFWSQHQESTLLRTIKNDAITNVVDAIQRVGPLNSAHRDALDGRVESELRRVNQELDGGPTGDRLKVLALEIKDLKRLPQTAHQRRLDDTYKRIEGAREEALVNTIRTQQRTGSSDLLLESIGEYKREFPSGNHRDEVEQVYQQTVGAKQAAARGRVRAIPITNRESLASKAKEIRKYLESYADDPQAAEMNKAASLAESVGASDALRLRVKGCGFSEAKGKRYHEVRYFVNDQIIAQWKSESESAASTLDKEIDGSYADWSRVRVELWDLNWGDEKMAHGDLDILRDLATFDGKSHFMLTDTGGYWAGGDAYVIIEVHWRQDQGWSPVPEDKLQAYGRYIAPGRDW